MQQNSLVSIIIPVYNCENYVIESVLSAFNQTHKNIEVICVNDGSTDKSEAILFSLKEEFPKLIIINQKNSGAASARNAGIKKSTGDYIKFWDADDIMSESHIELQLNALNNFPNHIASCEWGRFYSNDYTSARFTPESVWMDLNSAEWIKKAMSQKSDMASSWLWLTPRHIIDKAGYWNENLSLSDDFEYSMRLLTSCEGVKFARGAKAYYRSNVIGNLNSTISHKSYSSALLSTDLGARSILTVEDSTLVRQVIANRYQSWLFRMYPAYPDLVKLFENRIKEYGGSTIKIEGGPSFLFLVKIVGWKNAKKLKKFISSVKFHIKK